MRVTKSSCDGSAGRGRRPSVLNRQDRPRADIAIDVDTGRADIGSVGRFALANPDLVLRLRTDAPLNEADHTTFYTGGEHGYTDYPTLVASADKTAELS
jgi:N-ethylmaleimide reductase